MGNKIKLQLPTRREVRHGPTACLFDLLQKVIKVYDSGDAAKLTWKKKNLYGEYEEVPISTLETSHVGNITKYTVRQFGLQTIQKLIHHTNLRTLSSADDMILDYKKNFLKSIGNYHAELDEMNSTVRHVRDILLDTKKTLQMCTYFIFLLETDSRTKEEMRELLGSEDKDKKYQVFLDALNNNK